MNLFRLFQPAASAPVARERLQILLGTDLEGLVVGRNGKQARFELAEENARAFISEADIATSQWADDVDDGSGAEESPTRNHGGSKPRVPSRGNRVFITHRMKRKILEQVKELVVFGKFAPIVARDRESTKPSPHDVMDEMRRCDTAVIHVGADELRFDGACNEEPRISGDVLIEIIAAMALYGRNFILLVEEGVTLPANLQGLCECRYSGEELDMPAAMTLFKAFNDFTRLRPARSLVFAPNLLQYERTFLSSDAVAMPVLSKSNASTFATGKFVTQQN